MRCLRHKIHMGLFCAFGLSALNWIFNKSLQSGLTSTNNILYNREYFADSIFHFLDLSSYMTASVFDSVYCTSWVLTFFFYMASFYWMFIEGKINQPSRRRRLGNLCKKMKNENFFASNVCLLMPGFNLYFIKMTFQA